MYTVKPGTRLFSATVGYVIYYGTGILYPCFITRFMVVTPDATGWGVIPAVYYPPTMIPDYTPCILAVTVVGHLRLFMGRLME